MYQILNLVYITQNSTYYNGIDVNIEKFVSCTKFLIFENSSVLRCMYLVHSMKKAYLLKKNDIINIYIFNSFLREYSQYLCRQKYIDFKPDIP